jgi:hypothetical protein
LLLQLHYPVVDALPRHAKRLRNLLDGAAAAVFQDRQCALVLVRVMGFTQDLLKL